MAFGLFEVCGVELEWMIVDRSSLDIAPRADELLREASRLPGAVPDPDDDPNWPGGFDLGDIGWSNELTAHVVEFKTASPARSLIGVADAFHAAATRANAILEPLGLMLLPGGMHPWMDPTTQTRLWPHAYHEVYASFHRLFNCNRHGWANLQSCHINLPFAGDDAPDDEFGRLHAAIRAVLPLLPGLAASSPMMDGVCTGMMDSRLETYRTNATRVPEATGQVIPERVFTRHDYERVVFEPLYAALRTIQPDGTLCKEFSNARGAIARFSRGAIEIRLLDVQESPRADLAIVALVRALIRALVEGRIGQGTQALRALEVAPLASTLQAVIRDADRAIIDQGDLLRALGHPAGRAGHPCRTDEFWAWAIETLIPAGADAARAADIPVDARTTLDTIVREGCLARRLSRALGANPSRDHAREVYRALAACLASNTLFRV
jgi:gamma-glutamyl:cysteine ligase YbdK (ATP-grasp superfamily)